LARSGTFIRTTKFDQNDSLDVSLYCGNTEVARRLRRTFSLFLVSMVRTASFAREAIYISDGVSESSPPFCDMLRLIIFYLTEVYTYKIMLYSLTIKKV
jgi:hypothetical protein